MSQISCIETHIEMLMEPEELERIGADKVDGRELQLRVLRIFSAYNALRAENNRLKAEQKEKTCMCMDCGIVIKVSEQSNHLENCPKPKPWKKENEYGKKI